jgi:hypothetical protein
MTPYDLILQDLAIEVETRPILQEVPYTSTMEMCLKMKVTYECLLRSIKLKHRISTLVFAFFLGQLIEKRELSKRKIRTIMSEHYYIIAVRTYYIFEVDPTQIYNTKVIILTLIRHLRQQDISNLADQF